MTTAKKTAKMNENFESLDFQPEALKDGYERAAKGLSAFSEFQKTAFVALSASAGVLSKGVEKTASEQAAFLKAEYAEAVSAAKAAASSKSVQEAFEVQSDYARAAFERNLGHMTRLTDFWSTAAKEASEPLSARYGEFVEIVQSYRP